MGILAFILLPAYSPFALYVVLFLVLILSGVGLPIPEEVTLLLGGYLAYLEFLHFWPVVYVLIAGIIAADIMGYWLGRIAGDWISQHILSRAQFSRGLLKRAEWYFERHGEKVVLFSRPLLGVRVAVPLLAGHFRMSFAKFLLYDTIAAIPWTFFLVSLSYYLGSGLDLITEIREVKQAVAMTAGVLLVLYAAIKFIKNNPKDSTSNLRE